MWMKKVFVSVVNSKDSQEFWFEVVINPPFILNHTWKSYKIKSQFFPIKFKILHSKWSLKTLNKNTLHQLGILYIFCSLWSLKSCLNPLIKNSKQELPSSFCLFYEPTIMYIKRRKSFFSTYLTAKSIISHNTQTHLSLNIYYTYLTFFFLLTFFPLNTKYIYFFK